MNLTPYNPQGVPLSMVPKGWRFLVEGELGPSGSVSPDGRQCDGLRPFKAGPLMVKQYDSAAFWGPFGCWGIIEGCSAVVEIAAHPLAPPAPRAPSRWPKWDKLVARGIDK